MEILKHKEKYCQSYVLKSAFRVYSNIVMAERSYYLAFSNFPGIGPIKFNKLLKTFGSAKAAWNSSISSLESIIGKSYAAKFEIFRKEFDLESYLEKLK